MTSQQRRISRMAQTLDAIAQGSVISQYRDGTEWVKLWKQSPLTLKGAAFDSSIEIHFWHDKHGGVGLQHYICYIVFWSHDFSVHVYKWEGFFLPLEWDLFASSFTAVSVGWKEMLVIVDSTCWPTLNDVEIIKFNECDWVSSSREKHLLLKMLIFCNWIEVEMSASETRRINGPKLSKVPLIVLLNVKIVSFSNWISAFFHFWHVEFGKLGSFLI